MTINWGFIGASWVAGKGMVPAVTAASNAHLYAVASRDPKRSQALGPERVHETYADLIADPKVDAIYISLANHLHCEWVIRALEAGKHVLCEKPLAISSDEARQMIDAAQTNDRLLVEAVWSRWHPRFARAVELIHSGAIGQIQSITSEFTFTGELENNYRLSPEFGGGSLLDVGPYQVHSWLAFLNEILDFELSEVQRSVGPTGIDLTTKFTGTINSSIQVSALASFEMPEKQSLKITGNSGEIEFIGGQAFTSWNEASSLRVGDVEEHFAPVDPFTVMIYSMGERISGSEGWLVPNQDSLRVMEILDQVKASE